MKPFLETLNYSSSNEDGRSEIRALRIKTEDSVLCITGSGARTLDLLTEKPKEIISVDFNPCQNFLLDLKMTAIKYLEYEELMEFLGVRPSEMRGNVYRGIRQSLSADAKCFWDSQSEIIRRGVLYAGRWERYFRLLARFVSISRPRLRSRLFGSESIAVQSSVWRGKWDNAPWRCFLRILSSRLLWRRALGDPGFFLYVPAEFSIYGYFCERLASAAGKLLFKESPFVTLLFFGTYEDDILPVHLQKQHYGALREGLDRVRIVTQSLLDFLTECGKKSFDAYSLSDFASYSDMYSYGNTWKEILRTASEGARVCERQFLVKRNPPAVVTPGLIRDETIEKELSEADNSIFYSFVVGTIMSNS